MSEHILFVVNNYPPHSGGLEQHVFELARQLVRSSQQCTVVTLSAQQGDRIEDGVRVIRRPRRGNIGDVLSFPLPGTRRWLSSFIQDNQITAVSVHTRFFPLTWIGTSAARAARVPSIHTEHGSAYVRGVSPLIGLASWFIDRTFGRRALRAADVRLSVSQESADFVRKLSGKDASVFPNATNVEYWHAAPTEAPERFVFVGRMVPQKGWAESIEAFTSFTLENPDSGFELHLVGDGAELETARRLAANSPVAAHISVHGRQSHDEIRSLLGGQWLINPTQLAEGFQTTLLESAVAGAGIISFPTPGLAELEASGATILRATNTAELTEQLHQASQITPNVLTVENAGMWGWPVRAEQYAKIIEQAKNDYQHKR